MTDTDRYVLVYNGEVYNYVELRSDLEQLGHKFTSSGDTEVVLRSCVQWGVAEACRRFNGMFAFAFFDSHSETVTLARDLLGIKPLFFACKAGTVTFASELKCFGTPQVDTATVLAMLLGTPTFCPETPWEGVRELEPGGYVVVDIQGEVRLQEVASWRQLGNLITPQSFDEVADCSQRQYVDRWQELFLQGLEVGIRSDACVGIGVSGGVDSSLIVAGCEELGRKYPLFHAEVSGYESERPYAEFVANCFGMPLVTETVTPDQFIQNLASLTWVNDFPLGYHSNSIPFALVSQKASHSVKVLLTGEGADEFNGGYDWPTANVERKSRVHRIRRLAAILRRCRLNPFAEVLGNYTSSLTCQSTDLQRLRSCFGGYAVQSWRTEGEQAFAFISNEDERATQVNYFETCKGHLQSLLWRNDRMGMAASIESRFPFLDIDLITLQLNTPMRLKRNKRASKIAIRSTAKRLGLSSALSKRGKFGFTVNPSVFCRVDATFFRGGFLEQFLPRVADTSTLADWDILFFYMIAVEVWGRLFCFGQSPAEVTANLVRSRVA